MSRWGIGCFLLVTIGNAMLSVYYLDVLRNMIKMCIMISYRRYAQLLLD